MIDAYPQRHDQPETQTRAIGIEGAGTSAPVKRHSAGATVTRTGVGAYLITWAENPGKFLAWSASLGADTPAALAGHTVVRGAYNATAYTLAFVVYDSTFAAVDLAAAEYLDASVYFQRSGLTY
jgi:hypothetical protein